MASIETVVQNADVEMGDDSKPDSTAEVKEEPGESKRNDYLLILKRIHHWVSLLSEDLKRKKCTLLS